MEDQLLWHYKQLLRIYNVTRLSQLANVSVFTTRRIQSRSAINHSNPVMTGIKPVYVITTKNLVKFLTILYKITRGN